MEEPHRALFHAIACGLHHFKIKNAPVEAVACLRRALTKVSNAYILQKRRLRGSKQEIYDYLSMVFEGNNLRGPARKYLDLAIKAGETLKHDPDLLKYQYIKRALLHAHARRFHPALADLTHALALRPICYADTSVFFLDDVIYWEQAKILKALKNYPAARAAVAQVINLCQLNYKGAPAAARPLLLGTLKKYHTHLVGIKTAARRRRASTPPVNAERPENYDSFQVNSKCPIYLDFIAGIHAKPIKSLRDWEYLAAYKFSRYTDKRSYEAFVPDQRVAPEPADPRIGKRGLQYFYVERAYSAAEQFFAAALKTAPNLELYELCARAQIAGGNYSAAVATLTQLLTHIQHLEDTKSADYFINERKMLCRLMRGVAYAKINETVTAWTDFTTGLTHHVIRPHQYSKIYNMLLWERGKIARQLDIVSVTKSALQQITGNSACHAYLAALPEK